jgi:hypothetical protein
MSVFQSAIELAFESASIDRDVASGVFSIQLSLDRWADGQDVAASFPESKAGTGVQADFKVAMLGGIPLPQRFLPSDVSRCAIYEDQKYLTQWMPMPEGTLYIWDFENRRGVMWCTTPKLPAGLLGRPFLPLISAFAAQTDWCPLHASAVGRDGRFLLLVGPGRAGKSTAALSCAAAGWQYAGDDFVLVNPKVRRVEPLFTSGRLRKSAPEELTSNLSSFVFAESNDFDDPRFELRFRPEKGGMLIQGGVIEGILIPRRRGGQNFEIERAKSSQTYAAMVAHTRVRAPGRAEQLTKKLLAVTRMLPAHFIDTGNDITAIPARFQQILDEHRGERSYAR